MQHVVLNLNFCAATKKKKKKSSVKVEFLFRDQVGTAYFFIHSASSCFSLACFVDGALLVVQSMNQVISNS